jgi:hypothetical protein
MSVRIDIAEQSDSTPSAVNWDNKRLSRLGQFGTVVDEDKFVPPRIL